MGSFCVGIIRFFRGTIFHTILWLEGVILRVILRNILYHFRWIEDGIDTFRVSGPIQRPFRGDLLMSLVRLPCQGETTTVVTLINIKRVGVMFRHVPTAFQIGCNGALTILVSPALRLPIPDFRLHGDSDVKTLNMCWGLFIGATFVITTNEKRGTLPHLQVFYGHGTYAPVRLYS